MVIGNASRPRLCILLVLLLSALCWTEGFAVELEPIQLRSRIGEPLLAEIRVRDAPAELQELSVGLPDPVVFARIGLPRPRGVVADMRFSVHRGQRSETVIRVTTPQPVAEDFLTFLVEVQWREGSLVREFSIALPAADTAPMPAMVLDAPTATEPAPAAPSPDPASVDALGSTPLVAGDVAESSAATALEAPPIPLATRNRPSHAVEPPAESAAIPVIPNANIATVPAATATRTAAARSPSVPSPASPVAAPSPADPAPAPAAGTITVQRGGHLTGIARAAAGEAPLETALIAFLLTNPHAFVDGNINRLKQGETLQVPSADMLAAIDPAQARSLVALQADDWRGGSNTSRQQAMSSLLAEIEAGLTANPAAVAPIAVVPARMKIAPVEGAQSSADDRATQLRSGLEQETLATRDVEIRHLRQQVTDLERANDEQRALIAMQNEALAQAKRHLGGNPERPGFAYWPWLLAAMLIAGLAVLSWRHQRARPSRFNGIADRARP